MTRRGLVSDCQCNPRSRHVQQAGSGHSAGAAAHNRRQTRSDMVPTEKAPLPPREMNVRTEMHLHRAEAVQIRALAAAMGVSVTDFIGEATIRPAMAVELRLSLLILPQDAFEAFRAAISGPGRKVPGLARAAEASKYLLTGVDRGRVGTRTLSVTRSGTWQLGCRLNEAKASILRSFIPVRGYQRIRFPIEAQLYEQVRPTARAHHHPSSSA